MPAYPITLPSDPKPSEIVLRQFSLVSVAQSLFSGKQQVYTHPTQYWELNFDLPPLYGALAHQWATALMRLNGMEGTFYFSPTDDTPQGTLSGTIVVDAIYDYYLDVTGMTGTLSVGDWVQIESGLYRVTTGDTAVAGSATIEVWPRLRAEITAGVSLVIYSTPKGVFRMQQNFEYNMDVAKLYGITISAREVV